MLKKIANVQLNGPVIVAPMAGISNGAFREICHFLSAGLVCCEMVSDKAIFYHNKKTEDMLRLDDNIHPVSLQLFGYDPITMASSARVLCEKTNCDIIDINMGCPVNKVVKTGAGSALMRDEDLACEIVKSVLAVSNKPVTVKMRLGYDSKHLNYLSLAKKLEQLGVSAITLHARTRHQMYEGRADWEHVKILHEALSIPVIGNGDIRSLDDYIKYQDYCDGVMIGRALVGNPFLIKEINDYCAGLPIVKVGYGERFEFCKLHLRKLIELKGEAVGVREFRGIGPSYLSGLYNSSVYKNRMISLTSYDHLVSLLDEYGQLLADYQRVLE